jgi:hypothetical protein
MNHLLSTGVSMDGGKKGCREEWGKVRKGVLDFSRSSGRKGATESASGRLELAAPDKR